MEELPLGPDSMPQPGVPRGVVTKHALTSTVFANTLERPYWIYIPAQLKPDTPAPYMVFQDGDGYQALDGDFRVPVVFDNLIARGEIPPLIGIFIQPGMIAPTTPGGKPEHNRSFEYDLITDQYVRFLAQDLLPAVAKLNPLSDKANDHAIAGCSSGGICAFTAAWFRPDLFSKVMSHVGSFADMRGGHDFPSLVRKNLPAKPIRVFLQGSSNDLDWEKGHWWLANLTMHAALVFAKYDVKTSWDAGRHSGKNGGAGLPESLRWLWRPSRAAPPVGPA